MIRGGQAGEAQFIVAGVVAEHPGAVADELGRTLPEGAVNLSRLTEPAAAHAAAQHLHAGAVLHRAHHGHHEIFRRGVIVHVDDGLGDPFRHTGTVGADALHPAVLQIAHIIKGRHIYAGNFGQRQQQCFLVPAQLFALLHRGADVLQHLFAFAQLHDVKEIRHRLRVADAGAARDDERPALIPVGGAQRDAGQPEHGQHIGVAKLIFQ